MRYVVILVMGFGLCVVVAGTSMLNQATDLIQQASEMAPIAEFREIEGTDLYGNELALSEYRGKVVLLVFWSSGGQHAQEQQAYVKRLQEKFKRQPFAVVGINGDSSRTFAQAVAEQNDYDYLSWCDGPHGRIAKSWFVAEYPTYCLLNVKGEAVRRYDDLLLEIEVEQDIAGLLKATKVK